MTVAFEGVSRINLDRLVFSSGAPAATPTPVPTTIVATPVATVPPVLIPTVTLTATPTAEPEMQNGTLPALPGGVSAPRDPDNDGRFEDVNGNGRIDFADVTLLFTNLNTVGTSYPAATFDFNANGRNDYSDVTVLYSQL